MKYKVGDRVRIKTLETLEKEFKERGRTGEVRVEGLSIWDKMQEFCGEEVTISRIEYGNSYGVHENGYCWPEGVFEDINKLEML